MENNINFAEIKWSEKEYKKFICFLNTEAQENYKKFTVTLLNDKECRVIGIRTPVLRSIAKDISKGDYSGFMEYCKKETHEEKLIYGYLLNLIKSDYLTLMKMAEDFIPYITNWAIADCSITKFKQIKDNEEDCLQRVRKMVRSENVWEVRVGLNFLISNFVNEKYINEVLNICKSVNNPHYYSKMMLAWLVSECFIKQPAPTMKFLEEKVLGTWTQNKAIQKIRESFRVDSRLKEELLKLKK